MSSPFPLMVSISLIDRNGDPLRGAVVEWYTNGQLAGRAKTQNGHASITLGDPTAAVEIRASYGTEAPQMRKLAQGTISYTFQFDVEQNPRWKEFLMKHFPGIVGIAFMLLAFGTVILLPNPNALQTHIILGLFALGGGGFGGELAGRFDVNIKLGTQLAITAGGAAGIFALLYLFVPAGGH